MSQQSAVFDLSARYSWQANTLNGYRSSRLASLSSAHISHDHDPRGHPKIDYDSDEMTDEEQEQSLIRPLIDAHARASSSNSKLSELQEKEAELKFKVVDDSLEQQQRQQQQIPLLSSPRYMHRRIVSRTVTVLDGDDASIPGQTSRNRANQASEPDYYTEMDRFNEAQARNHRTRARLRQQQIEKQSAPLRSAQIIEKFSKWSIYSDKNAQRSHSRPQRMPRRTPTSSSLRRKDFSNRREIKEFARSGNFIFHRGFSLRRSQRLKHNFKFRNHTELSSFMDYVNIGSAPISDVLPSRLAVAHKIKPPQFLQLMRLEPKFVQNLIDIGPLHPQRTRSSLSRRPHHSNSIRRQVPLPRRVSTVRRSKSLSSIPPPSLAQSQNAYLYALWQRYLMAVLIQRVQFRMFLMASSSSEVSTDSRTSLSNPETGSSLSFGKARAQEESTQDLPASKKFMTSKSVSHSDAHEDGFLLTKSIKEYPSGDLFPVINEEEMALLADISGESASLSSGINRDNDLGKQRKVY